MNAKVKPFPSAGVPVLGQPFTITGMSVPMNVQLTCNCETSDRAVLTIVMSQPVTCPQCGKVYSAVFNPQTGGVQMQVGLPKGQEVPS
jgi:hypothetical protein